MSMMPAFDSVTVSALAANVWVAMNATLPWNTILAGGTLPTPVTVP
jgi:hypothetical protein